MGKTRKLGGTGRGLPAIGVRLPANQRAWIRRQAVERRSTQSEVVRELVEKAMLESRSTQAAPSIVDVFAEIAGSVPRQAWESLPKDLADHLDHYLYGVPKR